MGAPSVILLSPHNDDETLWCSFVIQRVRPHIVICFDSYIQTARGVEGCDVETRRQESVEAVCHLFDGSYTGLEDSQDCVSFIGLRDDTEHTVSDVCNALHGVYQDVTAVYSPLHEPTGHSQHNLVSLAARTMYPTATHHHYLTYTRTMGKSRLNSHEVHPQSADEIQRKLRALACYKSQMQMDPRLGTSEWFYGYDFREYLVTES